MRTVATSLLLSFTGALVLAASAPASVSISTTTATTGFSASLSGSDDTVSYNNVGLTVTENGQHNGWNLQVTSTLYSSGAHTLASDATAITQVSTGACNGSSCPTNSVGLPVIVPAGSTAPTPVRFFNAAAGSGTGTVTITPTFSTSVPGNSFAGTYQSTLTFSSVVGP